MFNSIASTTEESDSSAVGMDVFSTLFVIFVIITAVGTILVGALKIPHEASYVRVVIASNVSEKLPFKFGYLENSTGEQISPIDPSFNEMGEASALYVRVDQGNHKLAIHLRDYPKLEYIAQNYPGGEITVSIYHPLIGPGHLNRKISFERLQMRYSSDPDTDSLFDMDLELNYEGS